MTHPNRKFFCFRENDEYKMLPCRWVKNPRPAHWYSDDNHFWEEVNNIKIRFFRDGIASHYTQMAHNFEKVVLESWSAPDCISSKEEWGQWFSTSITVLKHLQFLKIADAVEDYTEIHYHFDDMDCKQEMETIQMPVDHIGENNFFGGMRPCVTPQAIIEHRSKPRGFPV